MGCATGCAVRDMQDSTVRHVPEAFPTPRQVLPPDRRTHELYVRELNSYLTLVAKHPQAFQNKVRGVFRHMQHQITETATMTINPTTYKS